MKVDLSKEEYLALLDMLYISEWVMNATKLEPDPRTRPYGAVEQKLLALAEEMGLGQYVEHDPNTGRYEMTVDYEEEALAHDFLEEYDEDTFWEELIQRMALRDLARRVGGYEAVERLSMADRLEKLVRLTETYDQEFMENGLENLTLSRSSQRPSRKMH